MELFDFCDASLLSHFSKGKDLEKQHPKHQGFDQKSLILRILERNIPRSQKTFENPRKDPFHVTKFDCKLSEHLKQHGGWTKEAQASWSKVGSLKAASKRLRSLQKRGLLDRNFSATPLLDKAISNYKERSNERAILRATLVRQHCVKTCQELAGKLAPEQKQLIATLTEFRQVTTRQAHDLKVGSAQIKQLQDHGLIESKRVLVDQKPLTLLTLSQRQKGKPMNGRDLAKYGLGIQRPFAGIQRDESKLLHDLSVIDAIEHAKARYASKGFQFMGAISEHRLYAEKATPTSDQGQKYADAYLLFKDSGGETINVAVEFGNYPPGYLKEKLDGIQADQILVYTHDENRAHEYAQIIENPAIEIHLIDPPKDQEIDR